MKVYIIMQSSGVYDSYMEEPIKVYLDEEKAQHYINHNIDMWIIEMETED